MSKFIDGGEAGEREPWWMQSTAPGATVGWEAGDGSAGEATDVSVLMPPPVSMPPWSGDEHFIEWAQTCPLNEWVRYEGPRFRAEVYMTARPAEWRPPEAPFMDEIAP